ncbi:MAG: porin [Candidatus Aminicenantales bacterium]
MLHPVGKRLLKRHLQGISVLGLTVLFLSGLAGAQEKNEPVPVTSSRSFKLSGYTQFLYKYWDKGTDSFSIPRARLTLSGELLKNVRFKIQVDAVKNPALMDAQIDIQFKPYLGLRFGQYYVPFSIENNTSDSELDTILRSQVVNALSPSRDIGSQGRDIGAMFTGRHSIAEYYLGVFNGAGINKLDTNKAKDVAARLILHPTSTLAIGGSLYRGRHNPFQGLPDISRTRAGLEAAFNLGAWSLVGEFISGKDDLVSRSGWYLQGGYFVLPEKLQAVVKWDTYDQDEDMSGDRTDLFTLAANWYLWKKTKLAVNYNLYRKEGEGTMNKTVSLQFQAAF